MRILHLSDLHITDGGMKIWDTDTKSHFDRAIQLISDMSDIDAIIITGDISDDGSDWSYSYVDNAFGMIGIPTFCCPGNHDCLSAMSRMKHCVLDKVVFVNGWRILNLNSSIPNMARGKFSQETMSFIDTELKKDDRPTIIDFHHPSIEPGGWLNRKLLENRNTFNKYLFTKPNVKLILYGHTHFAIQHKISNILFSSAPSVGFAFDINLPKFEIAEGKEGFNLIEIRNESISVSTILLNPSEVHR